MTVTVAPVGASLLAIRDCTPVRDREQARSYGDRARPMFPGGRP